MDDDAAMCSALVVGLERRGFRVWTLPQPRMLERLRADEFHVLLTDLRTPSLAPDAALVDRQEVALRAFVAAQATD